MEVSSSGRQSSSDQPTLAPASATSASGRQEEPDGGVGSSEEGRETFVPQERGSPEKQMSYRFQQKGSKKSRSVRPETLVCSIPFLARALGLKAGQVANRPSACDDRISCIQRSSKPISLKVLNDRIRVSRLQERCVEGSISSELDGVNRWRHV